MCNLSIFRLVRGKFPESFAQAQTVDTRPLFPPNTWPGYEANSVQSMHEINLSSDHGLQYYVADDAVLKVSL